MVSLTNIKDNVIGGQNPYDWVISQDKLPQEYGFRYCHLKKQILIIFTTFHFATM